MYDNSCGITYNVAMQFYTTQQWVAESEDLRDEVNPYDGGGASYWQESVGEVVQAWWIGKAVSFLLFVFDNVLMVFRSNMKWVSMTVMHHRIILYMLVVLVYGHWKVKVLGH